MTTVDFVDQLDDRDGVTGASDPILGLPWRDRRVLTMRSNGLTLAAIGGRMDITRERVRQIEARALKSLGSSSDRLSEIRSKSPYLRLKKAIADGDLAAVRANARQVGALDLADALGICVLIKDAEPERFAAATTRWVERFRAERRSVTEETVTEVSRALADVTSDSSRRALARILATNGLRRAHPVLFDDDRRAW